MKKFNENWMKLKNKNIIDLSGRSVLWSTTENFVKYFYLIEVKALICQSRN